MAGGEDGHGVCPVGVDHRADCRRPADTPGHLTVGNGYTEGDFQQFVSYHFLNVPSSKFGIQHTFQFSVHLVAVLFRTPAPRQSLDPVESAAVHHKVTGTV